MAPSTKQDYDNIRDLDVVNVLYVTRLPTGPTAQSTALSASVKSTTLWQAWEVTKAEKEVDYQVKQKKLPDDSSVQSKLKRSAHRFKVADYYRGESNWLVQTSSAFIQKLELTANEDQIQTAILHALLGVSQISDDPQILNLVKAQGWSIAERLNAPQQYVLTVVDHEPSGSAAVQTFDFKVTVQEDAPAAKNTSPPKSKTYTASVEYGFSNANFNFANWNAHALKDENDPVITLGKQILPYKQLTLLQSA